MHARRGAAPTMFAKQLISYLVLPLPVVLIILVVGVVLLWFTSRQRAGKIVVTVGVGLALLFSWPVATRLLVSPLRLFAPLSDFAPARDARWIVVLGGGFSSRTDAPPTSRLSSASLGRLVEGIRLQRQLPASKLVLSGGRASGDVPLAEVMAQAALSLGVRRADMVLETRTDDTEDEARLIRGIVGDDRFVLVTSSTHMRRAMRLFENRGMKPIAAPADAAAGGTSWLPSGGSLVVAEQADHEYVGMLWAWLRGTL
ncbi:MAG: ElyC/SanA/YdcF family protein [Pseudomonadota bacterium]